MKKKFIIAAVAVAALAAVACFPRGRSSETEEQQPTTKVVTADEYEQRFNEELQKRLKEKGLASASMAVCYADAITNTDIETKTRYTDKFLNSPAASGVGFGVSAAAAMVDVQPAGDNIELRFKSFYETTGKVRLLYQAYVNGSYQTLMSETVTCYAFFVPQGAQQWFNGTLTPPDMPQWSLEGIMPNDMCFERQLDTGDTQYFIARLYNPNTQDCSATNYSGSSNFGVEFNFWYSDARVIDSNGLHTFSISSNHPIRFISSSVNSIDELQSMQYYPDDLVFSSNLTVASKQTFYCSYVVTNDRPENTTVINENNYNTYNNYDYRKFPIYRITNNKFQSYDQSTNYETKYYDEYYIDSGITINNDYKTEIDYDTLQSSISAPLELQFKSLFDDIYSFQPDIGLEFNDTNNTIDYPSIVNPLPPSTGGWEPPSYPAVNTSAFIPAEYPTIPTETMPPAYGQAIGSTLQHGWDFFDGIGLLAFIIPMVVLLLLWRFTGK